jgi:hypothetical protein
MASDDKTMFEIFRETDYNRSFHYIFYTDLEEHGRDREIAKAGSGQTVFSGFLEDANKEQARTAVEAIVDELNAMDEEQAGMSKGEIERRLDAFLVPAP